MIVELLKCDISFYRREVQSCESAPRDAGRM